MKHWGFVYKSIPFVEKSIEFARQQPGLVTSFLNVDELAKDLVLARRLKKILNVIGKNTPALGEIVRRCCKIFLLDIK